MRPPAALVRLTAIGLGLLAARAGADPATTTTASADASLRVLVVDFVSVEPLLLEAMSQEVAALLSPAGLGLEWKHVSPATTSRPSETRLVLLPEGAKGALAGRIVLGSSHADRRGRTVWVYYPAVIKQVGVRAEALRALEPATRRRVGLALGRVVAHELIHALLPGWPHTEHGLMAGYTDAEWLLRRHVQLDEPTLAALRSVAGLF